MLPASSGEAEWCPATQWCFLLAKYSIRMNARKSIAPISQRQTVSSSVESSNLTKFGGICLQQD